MLNALIVDDEKLVRKEMRRITDWKKHGIEIVGEAESGDDAIHFLQNNPVDILFTDLSMPGMKWDIYIETVRRQFPLLRIVVLSMHQEFDVIQKALRAGVNDYIAKVEIDKASFDSQLKDIMARLQYSANEKTPLGQIVNCVYLPDFLHLMPPMKGLRLDNEFYILENLDDYTSKKCIHILVQNIYNYSYRQLLDLLHEYRNKKLFYEYCPDTRHYTITPEDNIAPNDIPANEVIQQIKNTTWLTDVAAYESILHSIPKLKIPKEKLEALLYQPLVKKSGCVSLRPEEYFEQVQHFHWWYEWEAWLASLQKQAVNLMDTGDLALINLKKALHYIDNNFLEDICQQTVLNEATMSKTLFSQMFKEYTGKTYSDYLRDLRLKHAKKLLAQTSTPIGRIGELSGYPDSRYFRRVFTQTVGMSPLEYRTKYDSPQI